MNRRSPWSDQPDTDGPEYLRPDEPEFAGTVAELTTVVVPDVDCTCWATSRSGCPVHYLTDRHITRVHGPGL